jgi:enoyl-CoA hydratase/carnithine racemase
VAAARVRSFEAIAVDHDGELAVIRLARPRQMNALNAQLIRELTEAVQDLESDDAVRVVVITGDDRAFSAGADLKETPPPDWEEEINAAFDRLETLSKPTIAAIRGWCIAGGLELAMSCDLRVAADDAKIGDWHVKIRSIGGAGATVRLPRLVGLSRAKELVFTGAAIDGGEAHRIGLVNRVCPSEDVLAHARALAREIAGGDAVTIAYAKQALQGGADLDLPAAHELSLRLQHELVESAGGDFGARFEARQSERRGTRASG